MQSGACRRLVEQKLKYTMRNKIILDILHKTQPEFQFPYLFAEMNTI